MEQPAGPLGEVVVPDVETLIRVNLEVAGREAGVRDRRLIEQAAARPNLGFGGVEAHPTVFDKTAALLHSLASTQGFVNGNKRTAWMAAQGMLAFNGLMMRRVSDAEAEAVVLGAATGAVTVELLAEWLGELCELRGRPVARYQSAVVRLPDLAHNGLIEGAVFDNCLLLGPAILLFDGAVMIGSHWDGRLQDLTWQFDESEDRRLIGAIVLRNVELRYCKLQGIGFAATDELVQAMAANSAIADPQPQVDIDLDWPPAEQ